jgi:hypothetical protein
MGLVSFLSSIFYPGGQTALDTYAGSLLSDFVTAFARWPPHRDAIPIVATHFTPRGVFFLERGAVAP